MHSKAIGTKGSVSIHTYIGPHKMTRLDAGDVM